MQKVSDRWQLPDDPYDQIAVWKGQDPDFDEPLYLITASFQNQPTFFKRLPESELGALREDQVAANVIWWRQVVLLCMLVIYGVAVVMAWRHYFYGRGDRRGALRVAALSFVLGAMTLLTQTRYTSALEDIFGDILEIGTAQVLYAAASVWVWYMALEPYVRRVWPHMLISASRLINGRWRDPVVGRDVLVGAALATVSMTITQLDFFVRSEFAVAQLPRRADPNVMTLAGMRELVGAAANIFAQAINLVFIFILLLIVCKILLRTKGWAQVGFAAIVIVIKTLDIGGNLGVSLIPATMITLILLLTIRFGALAVATYILVQTLLASFPITLDVSTWYFSHGVFAAILILLLAGYGYYASQDGRIGGQAEPSVG
jgi:serine/threonine-protein kinase